MEEIQDKKIKKKLQEINRIKQSIIQNLNVSFKDSNIKSLDLINVVNDIYELIRKNSKGNDRRSSLKGGAPEDLTTSDNEKLLDIYKRLVDYCPSYLEVFYRLYAEIYTSVGVDFFNYILPIMNNFKDQININNVLKKEEEKEEEEKEEEKELLIELNNILGLDQKPHQLFTASFLTEFSPIRGLVVYHSLGSGKTATAITGTLTHSLNRKTIILLPASIEKNFYGDIVKFSNLGQYLNCDMHIYKLNVH